MKVTIPQIRLFLSVCCVLWVGLTASLHGQGAPEEAYQAALRLQNQGNYQEAADAYVKVLEDYPTSQVVPEAQFRLGYVQYLLGRYEEATETFRKILGPPAPAQLQELAQGLIPQALAAKASGLEREDPEREKQFEAAIAEFDKFIEKYSQSSEMESVQYGRALSLYQIQKFEEAAQALRSNLQRFARSESILDSQYLLALTLATQANEAMREAEDGAVPPDAKAKYDEAERFLRDIVEKGTDVALANDAQFQIGELFYNHAAFLPKEQRRPLYETAMAAYRRVKPKADMVAAQEKRLEEILERIRQVGTAGDAEGVRRLQRLQEREQVKLGAIKERGDQTITAKIKVGQMFFQLDDYDASRVLLRFVQPFAETDAQKEPVHYYLAMTYALQNRTEQAVEAYNALYQAYPEAPVAGNLPLVLGVMFLQAEQPDAAIKYFDAQIEKYPGSEFTVETFTQKAGALVALKQFDEAKASFTRILDTDPRPEIGAAAEFGIAEVNRQTNQLAEAIKGFQQVREKYAGTGQAEQSAFWIAELTRQNGDTKASVPLYEAFLEAHPESELAPPALFGMAQAELQSGEPAAAIKTFQRLIDGYPDTEPAQFAYFQLANIHASQGDAGKMVEVMKQFIEKYPGNENVFFAYDSVAQAAINEGNLQEAIATYQQLVDDQPDNPQAPQALLKVAQLWRQDSELLGRYLALNEEQRAEWEKGVTNSIAAAEDLLRRYSESESVALALETLLGDQQLLQSAEQRTAGEIQKYFRDLAAQFDAQPGTRSKVLFTLAGYLSESDEAAALALMRDAYDPAQTYAPGDVDLYGSALIKQGELEPASALYEKLANDYPNPPGVEPQQAPPQVMEAQSIALYGKGRVLQEQGQTAQAGALFDRLKTVYPWSPKILEASYGIAQALFEEKKYDEAITLLTQIIRAPTATAELRANAMLLGGRIQEERGEIESSIDYYGKIARFYQSVRPAASEGLWKAGELIETKQVPTIQEAPKKKAQMAKAVQFYKDLLSDYPDSPFAKNASERLKALGQQ